MFKALYDYGKAHPEILLPPNWAKRKLEYIVDFTETGLYVGLRAAEKNTVVNCPDVGSGTRGSDGAPNPLMEKAEISICTESSRTESQMKLLNKKRSKFLAYLQYGADDIHEFAVVLAALTDVETLTEIQADAKELGVVDSSVVGFSVDSRLLSDIPAVHQWWTKYNEEKPHADTAQYLDLITGEPCIPAKLAKTISQNVAGGGRSTGVSLMTFNSEAFQSYGHKKGENAPMSQDTIDTIADAFIHLASKAPQLGGMKFLHWYNHEVPQEEDMLFASLFGPACEPEDKDDPDALEAAADRLILSPLSGEPPQSLAGSIFHIMIIKPNGARMTIRHYDTGSYDDLHRRLRQWFKDMTLYTEKGTTRYRTLNGLLYGLLTVAETKTKSKDDKFAPVSFLVEPLLCSCLYGTPIPDPAAARALANVRSQVYSDQDKTSSVPIQVLKLWINRNPNVKEEDRIMEKLNPALNNIGYKCGRLLAVYDAIQASSAPNVKSNVLERYFTACCQSPVLVLGQLQALAVHHLQKLGVGLQHIYEDELTEIYEGIDCEIPTRTTAVDQAYFVVGYYQQKAAMKARKTEAHNAKLAKGEDSADTNEE